MSDVENKIRELIINYCNEDKLKLKKYDKNQILNELRLYYTTHSKYIIKKLKSTRFRVKNGLRGNNEPITIIGLELSPTYFKDEIIKFYKKKYKQCDNYLYILDILVKNYVYYNNLDSFNILKDLLHYRKNDINFKELIGKSINNFKSFLNKDSLNWNNCLTLESDLFNDSTKNDTLNNSENNKIIEKFDINENKCLNYGRKDYKNIKEKNIDKIKKDIANCLCNDTFDYETIKFKIDAYLNETGKNQKIIDKITYYVFSILNIEDKYSMRWIKFLRLGLYYERNKTYDYILKLIKSSTRLPKLFLDLLKNNNYEKFKNVINKRVNKGFLKEEYEYFTKDDKSDEVVSCYNNSLNKNTYNESPQELVKESKEIEDSYIENEKTNDTPDDSVDLKEKAIDYENTTEVISNDNLLSEQTNGINNISDIDGLFESTENDESQLEEVETQTELDNNNNIFTERIIDLINLEKTLEKAGVNKSETRSFAFYLFSAYMIRIPILLAGPCGEQIANGFSIAVCGAMPYIFDCKNDYNIALVDDMLKSDNEVIIIKHPFATNWRETILELLAEGEKFYILTNPFYEDLLIEPISLYDYVMPFITEIFIDKPPMVDIRNLKHTKIDLPVSTSSFKPLHSELIKDMKLSKFCLNQIQTLLNEMHNLLLQQFQTDNSWIAIQSKTVRNGNYENEVSQNINNEILKAEYKYVLFPYAYVTNQGDSIAPKWHKIDKEANFYLSKYFNIKFE